MLPTSESAAATAVDRWLSAFDKALAHPSSSHLDALFHEDCHWRDVLALTWTIETWNGASALAALHGMARQAGATAFTRAPGRTPPRLVTRAGQPCIEAILSFETASGRCNGILRLTPSSAERSSLRAWTVMTALDQIKGHEDKSARAQAPAKAFSRDIRGPNWLDHRIAAQRYEDREPTILVVGAGQAGLSIAAQLNHLGVDTLVVDKGRRVGDNWRHRYHALVLHNQAKVNHLPVIPFPPGWPTYISKDKLANWFEAYAESLELNVWTASDFQGATWDEQAKRWTARIKRDDGTTREIHPAHIVMATGASDIPNIPHVPTLDAYKGAVLHSSQFKDGDAWAGKTALVIGTGTSGHDIAQDLHAAGAKVSIVQRSTTMVVNIEPSAQLPYRLYEEGPPLADCDLITVGVPYPLLRKSYQMVTHEGRDIDAPLLDALLKRGFRLDFGEDDTGWQYKYLTRGGGYYFNVGCSELIVSGEVGLLQASDIETFVADGVQLKDGVKRPADLVVLATGYKGQEALVRKLLGDGVADRVGPIWGFGGAQELRNMFQRTAQPGLWFIAGSFAQCRIYSKYLALQIKASEAGLLPGKDVGVIET